MRKLLKGLGHAALAMAIGLAAAYVVPQVLGEEFLVRQVARLYAPLVGTLHGERHRDEVSVMLIDDTSLQSAQQSWPAEYAYYARLLDAMTAYRPRAVFLDVIFAASRPDPGLPRLIAAACRAREAGVAVFFAARRDAAGVFRLRPELEAAAPRCLQKVAVEYDPDAADQIAWTYPVAADSYVDGTGVRSVAGSIYRELGGRLPAHQHSELALNWGLAPAARGIDWRVLPPAAGHHGEAEAVDAHAAGDAPEAGSESYCRAPAALWRELLLPPFLRERLGEQDLQKPVCVFHNTLYPSDLQTASDADEQALATHLRGRVVMVGTALQGSNDRVLTPLHGRIPGVYLHAMALDNLLRYGADYRRAAHLGFSADGARVLALVAFGLVLIMAGRAASRWMRRWAWAPRRFAHAGAARRRALGAVRWLGWKLGGLLVYSAFFGVMLVAGQWLHLGFLSVIHVALFAFAAEWLEWNEALLEWWQGEPAHAQGAGASAVPPHAA